MRITGCATSSVAASTARPHKCGFGPDREAIIEDIVSRLPKVVAEVAVIDGMRRSVERLR